MCVGGEELDFKKLYNQGERRKAQHERETCYYPPGHMGRSLPPPTYWLVLRSRNVPCSEHLDFFFFNLFIVKTELEVVTKYH